jgi:hypothetical protein
VEQPLLAVRVFAREFATDNNAEPAIVDSAGLTRTSRSGCPTVLTHRASPANIQGMAHSFLIFDFGGNEEAAQQARHRIEGWKQGFRLDKKMQVKFERNETQSKSAEPTAAAPKAEKPAAKGKGKSGAKAKSKEDSDSNPNPPAPTSSNIRLIVRLDFSDHEKLSHQRWIERVPTEEPFKDANPKVVRAGEAEFKAMSDLFDSLD